ncbi:MAG: translation initiation factor IF-2 [Acidobacteriota bacterium]
MDNIKIHELAKKLNKPSREIIEILEKYGISTKSSQKTISSEIAKEIEKHFKQKPKEKKEVGAKQIVREKPKKAEKKKIPKKVKEEKLREEKLEEIKIEEPIVIKETIEEKKTEELKEEIKKEIIPEKVPIKIREGISLRELSERAGIKAKDIIQKLFFKGIMLTVNKSLDRSLIEMISKEFNLNIEILSFEEEISLEIEEKPEDLRPRPPVVTVMGHVDHGKTTLLDYIRKTRVAEKEAGGITQHIGAYKVNVKRREITFIDTPGHEAFTRMRARGTKVTDIVVLVVAADDGVMPQTVEAIRHSQAAKVPIIVAINKIDKPETNVERVKKQLSSHGIVTEDWGGNTVSVEISAKTGKGIEELLEMILLVGDLQDLKANPNALAQGIILESKLDPKKGSLGTVLIQKGTLHEGDFFLSGSILGKVRALFNENGLRVNHAGPSTPVVVMGFDEVPEIGQTFQAVKNIEKAKQIALYRKEKIKESMERVPSKITLENLFKKIEEGKFRELPVIIKADVQGSVEVVEDALLKLGSEKLKINITHSSPGAPSESDILLASASNGIIIGLNVRPPRKVVELAQQEKVEMRLYTVIYELINDIKNALAGMLQPEFREVYLGTAEVKKTFRISRVGIVAGCYVNDGKIAKNAEVRIIRENKIVFTGKIASLRRFENDMDEVKNGLECGIAIERFNDIKPGDLIEAFVREKIQ